MKTICLMSGVVRTALAVLWLVAALVAGQATVRYDKFLEFFQLLDQSGALAGEYVAAGGDLCQVTGVDCENGQVVVIDFSNQGLVGELIRDNYVYENLPLLRNLNLRGNQLGYGVVSIPNGLSNLLNLNYLDLSNNAFAGEMPTFSISSTSNAFKKITHIDLSNNQLRGRLRWNWAQLPPSTGYVNLSGNNLSGALPEAWYQQGGMPGIDTLDVSRNNQDMCGDGGGQTQGSQAFAARGVTFSCKADGSDGPIPGPTATPAVPGTEPLFDEEGQPITGPDGDQIFLGPGGQPLVDGDGNSIVSPDGAPETDVHGNPVAKNPDGSPNTDPTGAPIYTDSNGDELVAPDGTSLHGPDGHFTQDANGNPAATGPDGQPVTDPDGDPVFTGPDGSPLVAPDGTSQTGSEGQPVQDGSGNPVSTDGNGNPVVDPDGNPVFEGPNGPLVDSEGSSIVGPDGDVTTDVNGNPVATTPDGAPVTDPDGDPIFIGPDGTPLVTGDGGSIIGPDGNITSDVDGNPVATNPDGTVQTDDSGNPIFIGDDGNPIVDENGQSTRGWNGEPLTDENGNPIPPAVFAPNGTMIPGVNLGGDPVFDSDGNPIFDSNGNPVVIPTGGKAPPTNGTVGGEPWQHGNDTALPNGDPASDLEKPMCVSPLPFDDPPVTCSDPAAEPVCLTPDQLVLNATALAEDGPLPPNLYGCDANVTSQTFFHQFFPGQTKSGAEARQKETLERMQSVISGNKPVSVVKWTEVYGGAPSPGAASQAPESAASLAGSNRLASAALVDEVSQRRLLTRFGGSVVPLANPQRNSLTSHSYSQAQRALQQVDGQDPIGVMGYFLIVGGDMQDLQSLVEEFAGVGQTIGEDGTPFLTQRQTSEQPDCGDTSTARTVLLSTLAVCSGILLAGLVITFYTFARLRKKPSRGGGHSDHIAMEAGSNTTITPSHTARGAWSEHDLAVVSPGSGGRRPTSGSSSPAGGMGERTGVLPGAFGSISGKMGTAGSFGSVMGGTVKLGEDSDSPRSGSRENDGASQASLGKSVLTLRDGMGGRKASGHFPSGSWQSGGAIDTGGREASLQASLSQDSDGGQAAPLAAPDTIHKSTDSSGTSGGSAGEGSAAAASQASPAVAAASVAASTSSGSGNGSTSRASMEHEFMSVSNGPLSPILENVTQSEINSETTSSMGEGSRMESSTAGISPAVPRPGSGSTLNPHFRAAVVTDAVAAESSLLDQSSMGASSSQIGESSSVVPVEAAAAAAAGVAGAAAAAVVVADDADRDDADEQDTFHSLQPSSLQESVTKEDPESPALRSHAVSENVTSNSPPPASFGTSAYPELVPAAAGTSFPPYQDENSALEQSLTSGTQLGSIGIENHSEHRSHSQHGAILLSSQASSIDGRGESSQQHRTDPSGRSMSDAPGFPGASSSFMFISRGDDGVMERMSPDAHVETQQLTSMSMLDSLQNSTMGARVLAPTAEEPFEDEDEGEYEEGDGLGEVEFSHGAHTAIGDGGHNTSDIGVDGGSLAHLAAVPFNPLLENSASVGLGDPSHMQSIGNPRSDNPGPSGVLRQAYDLVDSMGQVADHTVVPSDHLDTGVMISVPQRPANGSPGNSAQNLDFVAAAYRSDSDAPGPQLPAPTAGDSAENPEPGRVPSVMSSEEATGRLEIPTSLEEMMASQNEESQFRSIGSHALYASHGNSTQSHHSTHQFRSTQE